MISKCIQAIASVILGVLAAVPHAGATIIDPVTPRQLASEAELVFEGEVVAVDYSMSDAGRGLDALPHTFVTYQIDRLFKGDSELGDLIVLRFQGGPVPGSDLAMMVAGMPTFDVGDRDVLFVRDNGRAIAPLVGWGQGRFRIVDGIVYSDEGRELSLNREDRFVFGAAQPLTEVLTHQMGDVELRFAEPSQGRTFTPSTESRRMTAEEFARAIDRLIATTNRPEELVALTPQPSADPALPFRVAASSPMSAPAVQDAAPSLRGEADAVEEQLVEERLRQPVDAPEGPKQPERR